MYEYAVPPVRPKIVAVVAVAPVPSYATIDGVTPSPSSRYTMYPVGAPPAGADHVSTMLSIFISLNVIAPTAAGDVRLLNLLVGQRERVVELAQVRAQQPRLHIVL